ncbi:hypothetical protein HF086_003941 [Spodoptera exigua]|uniref:Uncharacterized protein n=1 Tax=Spodoptera exigua TaxID=7107 RepID=A0A922SCY7_SPOEX|nr:hypothetical protein HF086_003941 [Spodoptera exigua]
MSGASTSTGPPMTSISDVNTLFQNAKKYEELNVIGTGMYKFSDKNNLIKNAARRDAGVCLCVFAQILR